MARRATKRTPTNETRSVVSVFAGALETGLARGYGVPRPPICRGLHERPEGARATLAAVSFTMGWTWLGVFDVVIGRLGMKSRVDFLRCVRHASFSSLVSFPAPDPDLADEARDAFGQLAAIGRNVNRWVASRNSKVKRGGQLKLTSRQGQLLGDLPDYIDGVPAGMRERAEKRVSGIFRGFVSGMKGMGDGAH